MKYLSVCSGIEAASVAWEPLGWQPVAFSEIEPFPSAVLRHHWPEVPNLGDMTKHNDWPSSLRPDLIVGGTPCQAFSVAGLRKGLDDPRGNLTLVFLGILARFRPQWVVWENVPGVLSDKTGAFGAFLGGLGELGYGFAYRVLDAQYFGVPQRRRRVFVVGCLGGWQRAAAVLFESESLRGDSPPRREAGQGVAATIAARFGISRNNHEECVVPEVCGCLSDGAHNGGWLNGQDAYTGRIIPAVMTFDAPAIGQFNETDIAGTLTKHIGAGGETQNAAFIAEFSTVSFYSNESRCDNIQTDGSSVPVKIGSGGSSGNPPAVAFSEGFFRCGSGHAPNIELANTLQCNTGDQRISVANQLTVRRLTPRECERLQGFPDDHTMIPWRGREATDCPDGPRYKALGNSMAVPVMRWIGQRINSLKEVQP